MISASSICDVLKDTITISHINKLLKKTQFTFSQVFVCSHNITLSVPACGYITVLCAGQLKQRGMVFYLHFLSGVQQSSI